MKKISALYLISLYILLMMNFAFNLGDTFLRIIFAVGVFISVALGGASVVFDKLRDSDDDFLEEALFIKLGTVPFFILNFLLWAFGTFISTLFPILNIVLPIDTNAGLILIYSVLIITSCHSIISIYRLYREGIISKIGLIIYSILQCMFVVDVISYIILFFTKRNKIYKNRM
ncbi:MAG: hypothetical protein ACRC2K_00035 [Clostridium sp.]